MTLTTPGLAGCLVKLIYQYYFFFFFLLPRPRLLAALVERKKKKKARLSLQPCFVSNLNASVSARVSAALMKLQFGVMILNLLRFPAHVVLATLIEGFALL